MRFRTWMRGKERDRTPIGDLARDAKRDRFRDLNELVMVIHRECQGVPSDRVLAVACEAWHEYSLLRDAGAL